MKDTASPAPPEPDAMPLSCHRLCLLLAAVFLTGCNGAAPAPPPPGEPPDPEDIAQQVHTFCGDCHAYPTPDSFPKKHWRAEVERGYRFFEQSARPLARPPFNAVVRYYESRAPEEFTPPTWKPAPHPCPVAFDAVSPAGPAGEGRFAVSHVGLVNLSDPKLPDVLACDMRRNVVMLLNPREASPKWRVIAKQPHPARAEVVDLDGDGVKDILVANLGSFQPTDKRGGSVVWLRGKGDGSYEPITLLENVGRVCDVQAADFRGTGKLDLVVAVFGWQQTGELLFLENRTTDRTKPVFVPKVLDDRHGTIHVPVTDLDGDGKPDFVALFSQEHELVVGFLNRGGGTFEKKVLYRAPHPGYGGSGIQLVDMNGDGKQDVLYTNGDVLDEPYQYKPYHGVQWLENKGDLTFKHHPLTAMYGVHRAIAGDVTGGGRKDVLAVSFLPTEGFPDREKRRAAALVLLEQTSPGVFERHVLQETLCDYVACAVGDLYGTGRADLVLGNYNSATVDAPVTIRRNLGRGKK